MKNLCTVIALATFALSMSASAAISTVRVAMVPYQRQTIDRWNFRLNPELGRAWFEVDFVKPNANLGDSQQPPIAYTTFAERYAVPGMSYDAANGKIIIANPEAGDKGTVTCATVVPNGRKLIITPTGDCSLWGQHTIGEVDDGFNKRPVHYFEVYVDTRN